jgi:hypothetical protein
MEMVNRSTFETFEAADNNAVNSLCKRLEQVLWLQRSQFRAELSIATQHITNKLKGRSR